MPAEPGFDARHPTSVGLVVVANQVQQPVQCQHSPLGGLGVTDLPCLPPCHSSCDHDVAEKPVAGSWFDRLTTNGNTRSS